MIFITAKFSVKPEHADAWPQVSAAFTEATRAEPGCRMYQAHRSTADPRKFFLYEQYEDQAALDAHRASPHFARYATGGLFPLLESRTPELYEPLGD